MSPDAIPAATLVVYRPGPEGRDEHLFVERAATMAFAGGATVFPGGRVDPGDHALAARYPAFAPDDAAARIAAIRETIEETGAAIGLSRTPEAPVVERIRAALHGGAPFAALLAAEGLDLRPGVLVPFARWRPNMREARNFDTRFYLAQLPAEACGARVDATENVQLFWATSHEVLARAARAELSIIYPTRRNLERLAQLVRFDAAVAHAAAHPIETITPRIEQIDGEAWLIIPEGLGYPVTRERLTAAMRG